MKIKKELAKSRKQLGSLLDSDDVKTLSFTVADKEVLLVFLDGLTDKQAIGRQIMLPVKMLESVSMESLEGCILEPELKRLTTYDEVTAEVLLGHTVVLAEGVTGAVSAAAKAFESRSVSEPPTATVLQGPREGFVESIQTNIGMMRRRLKTEKLKFEQFNVGKYSDTAVCVCYIEGVVKEGLKEQIVKKIKEIDIDAVLDSSYIARFLAEHNTSLFKQFGTTEKPDILAAKILEGRVGVIVDGTPMVVTAPYILLEDFQSAEDYYVSRYRASLGRMIRLISIMISLLAPSMFVAAQLFHLQIIPLTFLLTIVNSIKGIPLSPSFEMFFTLLIFEVLNEASVRMPKYVGMVVSIVGGLVLGETAVTAGIISAPALMIIALSGICLYTTPELERQFSVIRVIFLIVAGAFGIYALLLAIGAFFIYLCAFENYGTPLLAPYAPMVPKDLKDGFIRMDQGNEVLRPVTFQSPNKVRMRVRKEKKDNGV
ncbi:MAG: hypothetical protein DBX59_09305 [Bacillota bacterium]|nr:MAG: hypothetical protein DBX59_09305 [Bacillota bacterium]